MAPLLRPSESEEFLLRFVPSSLTSENFARLNVRYDRNPTRSDCFPDVLKVRLKVAELEQSEDIAIERIYDLLDKTIFLASEARPNDFWVP
jgi:hypothetical protein